MLLGDEELTLIEWLSLNFSLEYYHWINNCGCKLTKLLIVKEILLHYQWNSIENSVENMHADVRV